MDVSPPREQVIRVVRHALEQDAGVVALWEGGSAATGRLDARSDIDLQAVVHPGRELATFAVVEGALTSVGGIARTWSVPEPTWHGNSQRFYQLCDAPEHLMVDLVVLPLDGFDRSWLEPERHGNAIVHFDRAGVLELEPFEVEQHRERIRAYVADLADKVVVLGHLPAKSLDRGHDVDALESYRARLLQPLVTLLGIRYRPLRFDFGMRYLETDLPAEWYDEVRALAFVASEEELRGAISRARALVDQLLAEIDVDALPLAELSAQARAGQAGASRTASVQRAR